MSKRPASPATDRNVCPKTTTSDGDNMSDYEDGCGPPDGRGLTMNGTFQIRCDNCVHNGATIRHYLPNQFIPVGSHVQRAAYERAMAEYDEALAAKDEAACLAARTVLLEKALKMCLSCRKVASKSNANPTSKKGKCRAYWRKLKETKYNKCAVCGGTRAIEANHRAIFSENKRLYTACVKAEGKEVAERKYPADERKLLPLSAYNLWACPKYGGVSGMQKEDAKMGPPLCSGHHRLDPSSLSAPCNRADPNKVKRENYATQKQFTDAVCKARTKKEKYEKIRDKKLSTSIETLTKNLPDEFGIYLNYCRSLKFEEKPDIGYLRKLFKDLFYRMGYEYDFVFDWMVKKPSPQQ